MSEKLIRASDARKAILNIDPKSAYCIDSVQAVDAVEVVRCKDCKCSQRWGNEGTLLCYRDETTVHIVKPDAYCDGAQRRYAADDPEILRFTPVVHGYWVGTQYDGFADGCPVYDLWECSECREEYESEGDPPPYNYCPKCGAKMDGESNG